MKEMATGTGTGLKFEAMKTFSNAILLRVHVVTRRLDLGIET